MEIRPLKLSGTFEILLQPHRDERGYFVQVYDVDTFRTCNLATEWVQESEAFCSQKGVVRGLHLQKPPFAETKLVRVVLGAVLDVFVDLRRARSLTVNGTPSNYQARIRKLFTFPKGSHTAIAL